MMLWVRLEYQICYNGGAHESKCKKRRLFQQETAIGADTPPPPPAGGKPKKGYSRKNTLPTIVNIGILN